VSRRKKITDKELLVSSSNPAHNTVMRRMMEKMLLSINTAMLVRVNLLGDRLKQNATRGWQMYQVRA
jgi:hypothetical protein